VFYLVADASPLAVGLVVGMGNAALDTLNERVGLVGVVVVGHG
jgi:hypothetical protein